MTFGPSVALFVVDDVVLFLHFNVALRQGKKGDEGPVTGHTTDPSSRPIRFCVLRLLLKQNIFFCFPDEFSLIQKNDNG